jgi:hypothetical protein
VIEHFHAGDQGEWYRLEANGERITFIVAASQTTRWKKWCASDRGKEVVARVAKEHDLQPFSDEGFVWGFGGCGRYDGEHSEDWDRLTIPLPVIGFDDKKAPDTLAGYQASFSLEMLLMFLSAHSEPASSHPQGLSVGMATDRQRSVYGGLIWADISPAMSAWCRESLTLDMEQLIDRTMKQAAARIWNARARPTNPLFASTGFRMSRDAPYLSCGLGGTVALNGTDEVEEGKAYRLSPHNTDGPPTQLIIFTGLAKLDELFHAR